MTIDRRLAKEDKNRRVISQDIIDYMRMEYHVNISYFKAWTARELAYVAVD
ncbi:hypothetical protein TorRG33x02_317960, partial [Trema orientale]